MTRFLLVFWFFIAFISEGLATHNRAGEITYRQIDNLKYEFTIVTCTKTSSPADRPELEINYGDGTGLHIVPRDSIVYLPDDAQINYYTSEYTFSGPNTYAISVLDPNRNDGVLNLGVPNSDQVPFCIRTTLTIFPFGGYNSSVKLDAPAKDNACINRVWTHNPGAYDPDGDSLVFSLTDCLGDNCLPILGYTLPNVVGGGSFTIDPATGMVTWDSPGLLGVYNIAILIEEYRNGVLMGTVLRDMQITVVNCNNNPPDLILPPDTCVLAGTLLTFNVTATDPEANQMSITGYGGPFNVSSSPAFMGNTIQQPGQNPATNSFTWQTNCDHVLNAPYATTFHVEDQGTDVSLSDAGTMFITVIAPPVTNPSATPSGNSILVSWNPSPCPNATGYKIYRRVGSFGYVPGYCETGVPAYTGYTFIGNTAGYDSTLFIDNNSLAHGEEYCYMIVACFADGAESIASDEVCATLNIELPVMTNVDVTTTSATIGELYVRWFSPTELDTIVQWLPPYHYEVYRGDGSGATSLVHTTVSNNLLYLVPNDFTDAGLNTESMSYSYHVLLHAHDTMGNMVLVGNSLSASSIFLTLTPDDNQISLSWDVAVPWENDSFEVYREYPVGTGFNLIGTTTATTYIDSGLINLEDYCYYVRSVGGYSDPSIYSPLLNRSQIACAHPTDLTAPCPPVLTIDGDCIIGENYLSWTNPNNICADDVMTYNLYYAETDTSEFELIQTFTSAFDTSWVHENNGSIAGCYYITALDSINPDFGVANESDSSNVVCIDNCPEYVLPNVFSPNDDDINDLFVPFPYKYVKDIDLIIYNRWGGEIFKTTDPDIKWDGKAQESKELVSDGVYYYICVVNTIRLSGIEPVILKGYVQVFSGDTNTID